MTDPDPIEAAIEAGLQAWSFTWDLTRSVSQANRAYMEAAAPILIQHGRELAAKAISDIPIWWTGEDGADWINRNLVIRVARGGDDE